MPQKIFLPNLGMWADDIIAVVNSDGSPIGAFGSGSPPGHAGGSVYLTSLGIWSGSVMAVVNPDGTPLAMLTSGSIASQAAAEAGTDNAAVMSPLRTFQAIDAHDNRRIAKTGADSVVAGDIGGTLALAGNAFYALTFGAASGYSTNFRVTIINEDAGRAKNVVLDGTTYKLWPGQWMTVSNQNNVWKSTPIPRYRPNAALTLWVRTDGSDTTSDGLNDSAGGAFLTIQKAFDTLAQYVDIDPQGDVQVKCGDGTFTGQLHWTASPPGGEGGARITLTGKNATGTIISTTGTAIGVFHDGILTLAKLKLQTATSGDCISVAIGGFVYITDNMEFGVCAGRHIAADSGGTVSCAGQTYTISGNATTAHMSATNAALIAFSSVTRVFTANATWAYTVLCAQNSTINDTSAVWTLGAFSVTGQRFLITEQGTVFTGTNNVSYYPGSTVGQSDGGVYGALTFQNTEVTVASAGTCDILGAASEKVLISGAVTITSFGTGTNRRRDVRFSGAPLLTHNATSLILPGGVDYQVTAGDTCVVISDGSSNCRVYAMSRPRFPQPVCLLFSLIGANMNSTADQQFVKAFNFTNYILTQVRTVNGSVSLTTAVGGIYTATSKGGLAIVPSSQAYSGITGANTGAGLTLSAAGLSLITAASLYLSLTTAQGSAATADLYITGTPLT